MKVKLSDLFFVLYSEEFINSLMEYLNTNYSPTSTLEVEISSDDYHSGRYLTIKDYDIEGIKVSHKEVFMTDILGYNTWTGKDIEVDVMDYLCSAELGEKLDFCKIDMED